MPVRIVAWEEDGDWYDVVEAKVGVVQEALRPDLNTVGAEGDPNLAAYYIEAADPEAFVIPESWVGMKLYVEVAPSKVGELADALTDVCDKHGATPA